MDLPSILDYAQRIANKMSRDPEVLSLAGLAAWKAQQTFNEDKNVPEKRWIALIVKQHIWGYWRELKSRREVPFGDIMDTVAEGSFTKVGFKRGDDDESIRLKSAAANFEPTIMADYSLDDAKLDIAPEDWKILEENYVYKWPLDVIAKRNNITLYELRKRLAAAKSRLELLHENAN